MTGAENYGYNAANMLTSRVVGGNSQTYSNDLDGNTLTGGGRTNTLDSENRLTQCVYVNNGLTNSSVYIYGGDGLRRRAAITTGGTTTTTDFVLDNSMFVRELRSNAGVAYNYATYLVGPRGPEYRRDDVGQTVRWYVYDGLGSVLAEVDPNGNVTASRKYDVYGGVRSSTGTSTSKHKFVGSLGHPSDDESCPIYMESGKKSGVSQRNTIAARIELERLSPYRPRNNLSRRHPTPDFVPLSLHVCRPNAETIVRSGRRAAPTAVQSLRRWAPCRK